MSVSMFTWFIQPASMVFIQQLLRILSISPIDFECSRNDLREADK